MKLETFTPATFPADTRKGSPRLTVSKTGCFALSKTAQQLIGLTDKDKVQLARDPKNMENYYLLVVKPAAEGFTPRKSGNAGNSLFNCSKLAAQIRADVFELGDAVTVSFLIAGTPTEVDIKETKNGKAWGLLKRPLI